MTENTINAAIRSVIVSEGSFNERVFLRHAPEGATMPYVTFMPDTSITSALYGDGENLAYARQVIVDLWQKASAERSELVTSLRNALDGATIEVTTGRAWRLRVESDDDVPEPLGTNVVHHSFTCALRHDTFAI